MWQDHKQVIEELARCWPAAFTVNPRLRRPLKLHVERDIKADELALAVGHPVDVEAAVAYYTNNISYVESLLAGAVRVDLHGNPAGTVTPAEAIAARKQVDGIRRTIAARKAEQQQPPAPPARARVLPSIPEPTPPAPPQGRPPSADLLPAPAPRSRPGFISAWGEAKSLRAWAADPRAKVRHNTLYSRLVAGWEPERAIATPPDTRKTGSQSRSLERNREIARRYAAGERSAVLAREFGISPKTIRDSIITVGGTIRPPGRPPVLRQPTLEPATSSSNPPMIWMQSPPIRYTLAPVRDWNEAVITTSWTLAGPRPANDRLRLQPAYQVVRLSSS
jgi:ProP effector